jgi:hypothetical protein
MANGNTNNAHPGTPNGKKGLTALMDFVKGNPIFAALSALFLLAFILPPRKRKQKRKKAGNPGRRKKSRSRKRKTGTLKIVGRKKLKKAGLINNTGNPGKKTKSGKKIPRSVGTGTMPARFLGRPAKGSKLAKEKMEWLRSRPGALHLKKK